MRLKDKGILAVIAFTLLIIVIPLIVTFVLGVAIADYLGLTGIVWWSFMIIFYLVIGVILKEANMLAVRFDGSIIK